MPASQSMLHDRQARTGAARFARTTESENINSKGVLGAKRPSPRLGACTGASNRKPLSTRSRETGSVFGDITNIAKNSSKPDKLQPVKSFPQPMPTEATTSFQSPSSNVEPSNAQEVDEYVPDIVDKLFAEEEAGRPQPDYMDRQNALTPKMRTILVDWLIEVHLKYKLRSETLHLGINLIDRYLSKVQVARNKLQLIGVVAMFIASKFEEIHPPEIKDWVYITDGAYTKDDVFMMENHMLTTLSFKIAVPTAAHFFDHLVVANGCDSVHRSCTQYLLELGLLQSRMLQYRPSHIVSAALLLSNELFARSPVWPQAMMNQSGYAEPMLGQCVQELRQLLKADRADAGGQQAVYRKFSTPQHHAVATMSF